MRTAKKIGNRNTVYKSNVKQLFFGCQYKIPKIFFFLSAFWNYFEQKNLFDVARARGEEREINFILMIQYGMRHWKPAIRKQKERLSIVIILI